MRIISAMTVTMKNLFILVSLFMAMSASAALPPTAESLRRLKTITTSSEVFDAFGASQWVKSIQENEDGSYTVISDKCALSVNVQAIQTNPPQMVPELKVIVGMLVCTASNSQ